MILKNLIIPFHFTANFKLVHKLLFSYIVIIIIPLILVSGVFYKSFSSFSTGHVTYSTKQSFEQAYSFLSYKLNNIKETSNVLIRNENILNMIKTDLYSKDDVLQMENMNSILSFLTSLQDETNVARVRLYVPKELIYANDNRNIFNIDLAITTKWYDILKKSGKTYFWCPSSYLGPDEPNAHLIINNTLFNKDVLSLTKLLLNPENYSDPIAAARFDFLKSDIIRILKKANTFANSLTYIVNSQGEIVAASSVELLKKYKVNDASISLNSSMDVSSWITHHFSNEAALVGYRRLDNTDWCMVTVIPMGNIAAESKHMRNYILVFSIMILTGAIVLAYIISYSITKGISELAGKMRNLHKGELEPIDMPPRKDEIGMLIENYNYMTERMIELIREQYRSGQELKNAELKALQAQINPHFLYNTLDMINWFAYKNMGKEITATVESLARFYKLSLSNGKEIISIGDELLQVSSYFHIQSMRFGNKINLNINIDDEIRHYSILKLILQPIVENSILHGILYKESKSGTITISGKLKDHIIILKVEDDGIGIPEDKLIAIMEDKIKSNYGGGFGIRNINQRIKLYYGSEYGLTYFSDYGKGAAVEIMIPAVIQL
jgi:two-component system, sensor histidine kinase YesM